MQCILSHPFDNSWHTRLSSQSFQVCRVFRYHHSLVEVRWSVRKIRAFCHWHLRSKSVQYPLCVSVDFWQINQDLCCNCVQSIIRTYIFMGRASNSDFLWSWILWSAHIIVSLICRSLNRWKALMVPRKAYEIAPKRKDGQIIPTNLITR